MKLSHGIVAALWVLGAGLSSCGGCGTEIKVGSTDGGGGDGGSSDGGSCSAGKDSDADGVPDDEECRLGTNPTNNDSDGDGIPDGAESTYPKACVATSGAVQRRPPPACTSNTECLAGEECRGLDPSKTDSDGDGVVDQDEDLNGDGVIDPSSGETDPRLADTDGDGQPDSAGSGLDICRPSGLATVTRVGIPSSPIQVGHDPAWGTAITVTGSSAGAVLLDDAVAQVSALVGSRNVTGADVRAEATAVEGLATAALGAGVTPVLVGVSVTTHETLQAISSTYRVARAETASGLRDAIVQPLTGSPAPGGKSVGSSAEFLVDITTVWRGGGKSDVIITIAPRADYEDTTKVTAIRSADLVNTTGVAEGGKGLGNACQVFQATKSAVADFLWTVDTSGSMGDDQARLGNTATRFFQQMQAAGVDFRVAVLTAGSAPNGLNVDTPGLTFIVGTDADGPRKLCEEVTSTSLAACPTSSNDTVSPYPFTGAQEEPTAAAVIAHDLLTKRGAAGETNLNRRFRQGAKVVTFHVTDEPGSNDFSRYFAINNDPQTGTAFGTTYNQTSLNNIVDYFKRNKILTYGLVPVNATACSALAVADLPRCVIEGNNGAVIPIATALQAEVDAAMSKIVLAVAGATSTFQLKLSPITSTIKVRVRGMDVPRSRSNGFDYDAATKAIIFFGTTYRPNENDQVVISYRVWEGSIG